MRWITNCEGFNSGETIARLCRGHQNRQLVLGEPKPATVPNALSLAELKQAKIVGIYEVDCDSSSARTEESK